jgi:hypothetical protein
MAWPRIPVIVCYPPELAAPGDACFIRVEGLAVGPPDEGDAEA